MHNAPGLGTDENSSDPTALILVNPRARRAGNPHWLHPVRVVLAERYQVDVAHPASSAETERLARDAAARGVTLVVAAGGDGTIHAVANGLAGSRSSLGLIPLGTANDLARELGVAGDLAAAARALADGRRRLVDLGRVTGRRFLTVGGLGLVSASALSVTRAKERSPLSRRIATLLGGAIYRVAAAALILGQRDIASAIKLRWTDPTDGRAHSLNTDVHALFVTNHRTCGAGLTIPSGGSADDGVFELCLVPATSRARLVANLQRLSAGRDIPMEVLTVLRATAAAVELERADSFIADGELVAQGTHFELGIERQALSIIV